MPQLVLSGESSSGEDDFAVYSNSDSPAIWSPKLTRIDQQPGMMTDNEKVARKVTFCRLPTSSFQTPPTPPSSMLTRALRRLTVNNSQASMKSAENYRKREWDPQGWSELIGSICPRSWQGIMSYYFGRTRMYAWIANGIALEEQGYKSEGPILIKHSPYFTILRRET